MKKMKFLGLLAFVWLIGILDLTVAVALSDPINQTFSEYNNMTRADNIVELGQVFNQWVGGLFGIGLMVVFGFLLFGVSQFFTTSTSNQILFTLFFMSMLSVFLRVMEWTSDLPFYFVLGITVLAVGLKVVVK